MAGGSGGASGGAGGGYGAAAGGAGGGTVYGIKTAPTSMSYNTGYSSRDSGIGSRGQEGRTQNKNMREILAMAPPAAPMTLRPSQGVRPGDKTGSGASGISFAPANSVVTDKGAVFSAGEAQQFGSQMRQLYDKLFSKPASTREDMIGSQASENAYQDYRRGERQDYSQGAYPQALQSNVNYLGGGGGIAGSNEAMYGGWGYM